jgi:hypothetical protein
MSLTLKESNNLIDKKIKEIANNIKNLKKNNITTTITNNNDYYYLHETIKQKDYMIYYMNMKLTQFNNIINYQQQQIINNNKSFNNNKTFNDNIYLDDKYYDKIKKYIKNTTNKNIKGVILNNDGHMEYLKLKRK